MFRITDTIYKIVPERYIFFPKDPRAIDSAVETLKMLVQADNITWKSFENPAFIDCGSNFESVACSSCGSKIDISLWQEMMSKCYEESRFNDLSIFMPCCNNKLSLNDLTYKMDCAFATFVIEIFNPGQPLSQYDIDQVRKCFGELNLRMIISRY